MQSVTYRRRDYLFAVRRKVVDDQLGWTICMRSPRTHEWLPILGERPFVGHAEAEASAKRRGRSPAIPFYLFSGGAKSMP